MNEFTKSIIIDPHTLYRAEERGTNESEIFEVIRTGINVKAKYGREGKYKVYDFNKERNDKFYKQKKVEVIYAEYEDKIITVTVYVFYGKWEDK